MAQGDWTDPALGRITFGEYALAWLDSRTDLKPKTRHQYRILLRLHILPTWRTVPLAKVTFEGLTQWVARLTLRRARRFRACGNRCSSCRPRWITPCAAAASGPTRLAG